MKDGDSNNRAVMWQRLAISSKVAGIVSSPFTSVRLFRSDVNGAKLTPIDKLIESSKHTFWKTHKRVGMHLFGVGCFIFISGCCSSKLCSEIEFPVVDYNDFSTPANVHFKDAVHRLSYLTQKPGYKKLALLLQRDRISTSPYVTVLSDLHFSWESISLIEKREGWRLISFTIDRRKPNPYEYKEVKRTQADAERIFNYIDQGLWSDLVGGYTDMQSDSLESIYSFVKVRQHDSIRTQCVQNLGLDSLIRLLNLFDEIEKA